MKDVSCEKVLMAKMAEADGERAELLPEVIEWHLSICERCRAELAELQRIDHFLQRASRAEQPVALWPSVSQGIRRTERRFGWKPFAAAGVMLLAYKLVEMVPEEDPGMALKIAPLIIFACLILFLRENPFKINTELVLEK